MADYFKNPEDLSCWIKARNSSEEAANELLDVINMSNQYLSFYNDDETDIKETCKSIYDQDDANAANVLFGVLAKHNITKVIREGSTNINKTAQTSRQRNNWVRGDRNKWRRCMWNKCVDGYNEGTPWRTDRDKFFNFTHYYTDALSFDENPNRVYSGEALWRMYVMDKFYREYKNAEGKWVGGYINDRFHVFPTAGTPANPDAPRDGGNQMELANAERTRKPRPHQYSIERRLEEARGNDTYDLEVTTMASSFKKIVKTASTTPKDRKNDKIYSMFTDIMEMKQAGFIFSDIVEKVSDHYGATITGVAQIAKFADKMIKKHDGIAYQFGVTSQNIETYRLNQDRESVLEDGSRAPVKGGTILIKINPNLFQIGSGQGVNTKVMFDFNGDDEMDLAMTRLDENDDNIQEAADELGLNESQEDLATDVVNSLDFPVDEV